VVGDANLKQLKTGLSMADWRQLYEKTGNVVNKTTIKNITSRSAITERPCCRVG